LEFQFFTLQQHTKLLFFKNRMAQAQLDQIKEKITFTSSEYVEEVDNSDTVTTSDNHQNELVAP
jgi:hypothetical protein